MATVFCEVCRKVKDEEGSTLGRVNALDENILICADCRGRVRVQSIEVFEDNYSRWDERGEDIGMIKEQKVGVNGFDKKTWCQCSDGRIGLLDAQWVPHGQTEATHWRIRFDRSWFSDDDWRDFSGEDPGDPRRFPIRAVYRPYLKSDVVILEGDHAPKNVRQDPAVGPRQTPTKEQVEKELMKTKKVASNPDKPSPVAPSRTVDTSNVVLGSKWYTNKTGDEYVVREISADTVKLVWTGNRRIEGEIRVHGAPGYKRDSSMINLVTQYRPEGV